MGRDFVRLVVMLPVVRAWFAILAMALGCGAVAPSPSVVATQPADPIPSPPVPITATRLRELVEILASDAFAGRGTLEEGETRAARFLVTELERLGLTPLPGFSSFIVPSALETTGFDPQRTLATVHRGSARRLLRGGVHFKPFWFSRAGVVAADVVFVGYGISRPDLGYDDYDGLDVDGKVVLVLRHAPKRDDSDKRFEDARDALFANKAELARKRGAVGMILVDDPRESAPKEGAAVHGGEDMRMSGRLRLPDTERSLLDSVLGFVGSFVRREPPAIHSIFASGEVGEWMAEALGVSLAEAQRRLDAGGASARDFESTERLRVELEVGELMGAKPVAATNVVAFLRGTKRPDEWVVVGAHFDHLGHFEGDGDTIYNGADDNASGTAAMLAVAEELATGPALERSIAFVGFSAEEKGLLGSKSLVRGPLGPERVVFMVNMDMLGRNPDKPVHVGGDGYARGLAELVSAASQDLDLRVELGGKALSGNSDHFAFFSRGIPVMNLFTGLHDDYHQLSDVASKLDYSRMAKIAELAARVTRAVADANRVPSFVYRPMWLGAAFVVEAGAARAIEIEDGSPAAKAGLQLGDVLVSIDGEDAVDGSQVSHALEAIEPGTRVALGVGRASQRLELQVARARPGFLGVFPGPVGEETQARFGLAPGQGIEITGVTKGGPAEKAGILSGDLLVEIAGQAVGIQDLGVRLARIGAGEKVPVVVIRGKARVSLTMILGERPQRAR